MVKYFNTFLKESLNDEDFYIGMTVRMNDDSDYRSQAYEKNGDGFGKILRYCNDVDDEYNYTYSIKWNNGHRNSYRKCDVTIIDDLKKFKLKKFKKIEKPDVDPYNEENWGYEEIKESLYNNTYNLREICNDYMDTIERYELSNNDLIVKYLNKLFVRKKVEFYRTYVTFKGDMEDITTSGMVEKVHFKEKNNDYQVIFTIHGKNYSDDMIVNIDKPVTVKTKIVLSPEDPYGEEDWSNESKIYESYENDIIYVKIINSEEDILLRTHLEKLGFKWKSGSLPTEKTYFNIHRKLYYVYMIDPHTKKIGGTGVDHKLTKLNDLIKNCESKLKIMLKNKEEKRLKYKDIDPYGEEDWNNESKIYEYVTWNDNVTEKTIDLEKLYEQQKGNPDHILQILQYEFRQINSEDEHKRITLYPKNGNTKYIMGEGDSNVIIQLSNNKDGIVFIYIKNGGKSIARLLFSDFKLYVFKIEILKRRFVPEDPYGEEDWNDD